MFHSGIELFEKFRVSVESEIGFTDFCKNLLFSYIHGIKCTSKALLFLDPKREHHDWYPASTIEFIPCWGFWLRDETREKQKEVFSSESPRIPICIIIEAQKDDIGAENTYFWKIND